MLKKALQSTTTLLKRLARRWMGLLKKGGFCSYLVWLSTALLVALFLQSSFKVLKYVASGKIANDVRVLQIKLEENVDWDGSEYKKKN